MMSRTSSVRAKVTAGAVQRSDAEIALACNDGEPDAVAELFERFQGPVTRFLSRLVTAAEVEDLVQATFLQVARGKAQFDGRSTVRTWLFAIAANVMRQHCRSSARRKRLLSALSIVHRTSTGDGLMNQIEARRSMQCVFLAFEFLAEKTRMAFVLCELEGLSAREASQVLESTETAIWKRVSEARRAMLRAADGCRS